MNGKDQVIEQRTYFNTAPHSTQDTTGMPWTQFADVQNQFHGGGVVGEYCCDGMRCFDYPVSRSVWSCVLDILVVCYIFCNEYIGRRLPLELLAFTRFSIIV